MDDDREAVLPVASAAEIAGNRADEVEEQDRHHERPDHRLPTAQQVLHLLTSDTLIG